MMRQSAVGRCRILARIRTSAPGPIFFLLAQLGWASGAAAEESAPMVEKACAGVAGDYSFNGTVEIDGKQQSISFLERMTRPGRPAVRWMRMKQPSEAGELVISLLDDGDEIVGKEVRLDAKCVSGKWEVVHRVEGNSDGTAVKGTKTWWFFRSERGALYVEYSLIAAVQYFPGIKSPREVRNRASFPRR